MFPSNGKLIAGRTLGDWRQYYTVNVKMLQSMSHEQFCLENPEAAHEMERLTEIQNKLAELVAPAE